LNDLAVRYGVSLKTIRRHFDKYTPDITIISSAKAAVALSFDGTFFGRGYGLMVYRACGKNIYWQEMENENLSVIEQGLRHLIAQGWQFSSITVDGRQGTISLIKRLFPDTPIQFCLFHQKAIIRRYLTTKPKTACGKEVQILVSFLAHLGHAFFLECLADIQERYAEFLAERNEKKQFMHRKLRSALRSLRCNAPHLYTYKNYPELHIPSTTNSCDGSFAHWKNKVKIHRGLSKARRAKMIHALLAKT